MAKRKNKTIMNMVRSVLIGRHVPKLFWLEATRWCIHIINRTPTTTMQDKTPEEAWGGIKPSIAYFRVFGCIAHVHTSYQHRIKLDGKSKRYVLLGVSDESKAYRLFDPVCQKIIIIRDVIFEEEKSWDWEQHNKTSQHTALDWSKDTTQDSNTEKQTEPHGAENSGQQAIKNLNEGNTEVNTNQIKNESHLPHVDTSVEGRARRCRREPVWMIDYEKGEGLSDEDSENAMTVIEDDPVTFEEAVKSRNW